MKFSNCKLKPLCLISELIGLSVPNILNYTGLPVLYVIYVVLLLSGLIFTCVQTFAYKVSVEYGNYLETVTVLDFAFNLLLASNSILSLLYATFFRRRSVVKFFKKMRDFDETFHRNFGAVQSRAWCFYFEFISIHVLILAYVIYGDYFISTAFADLSFVYYYCIHFTINVYFTTITVLQVYYYTAAVNERLYNTNLKTENYVHQHQLLKKFEKNLKGSKFVHNAAEFREHLKCHNDLCDLFDLLSDAFGLQVFLIILTTVATFLNSINICLKYFFGTFLMGDGEQFAFAITTSIVFAIFSILISLSCGKTGNELRKIRAICCELLIELGIYPKTTKEELIYRQLNLLDVYMNGRNNDFSAAGFVDVNYNLMYTICGCAAGYIVICLQFP